MFKIWTRYDVSYSFLLSFDSLPSHRKHIRTRQVVIQRGYVVMLYLKYINKSTPPKNNNKRAKKKTAIPNILSIVCVFLCFFPNTRHFINSDGYKTTVTSTESSNPDVTFRSVLGAHIDIEDLDISEMSPYRITHIPSASPTLVIGGVGESNYVIVSASEFEDYEVIEVTDIILGEAKFNEECTMYTGL